MKQHNKSSLYQFETNRWRSQTLLKLQKINQTSNVLRSLRQRTEQTEERPTSPIYKETENNELINIKFNKHKYIIHPQYMKHRGTMCMSEMWSQKMKKEFISVTQESIVDAKRIGLYGHDYTSLYRPERIENEAKIVLKMNDLRIGIEVKPQTIEDLIQGLKSKVPEAVLKNFESEINQQLSNMQSTIELRQEKKSILKTNSMSKTPMNDNRDIIQLPSLKIIKNPHKLKINTEFPSMDLSTVGRHQSISKRSSKASPASIIRSKNKRKEYVSNIEEIIGRCDSEMIDDIKVQQQIEGFLNADDRKKKERERIRQLDEVQLRMSKLQREIKDRKSIAK